MQLLYLVSVWVHLMAATVWVGGMAFLVLVMVPWLRRTDRSAGATLFHALGRRFSRVGWVSLFLLALTGTLNAYFRGVRAHDLLAADFVSSVFGGALVGKIGVFLLVLVLSAYHDFSVGPRATLAIARDPDANDARVLRRVASWCGRLNALLALVAYALAVTLVRGCPL